MNIKLSDISITSEEKYAIKNGYIYKDISLDLDNQRTYNSRLNTYEHLNDVQAIFDVVAIQHSVKNAFLTSPGQKILNPTFGIDLRRYIFDNVSDLTAYMIKRDIEQQLPIWEPRIIIESVDVDSNEDEQEYIINLQIDIPILDITGLTISGILNSNGYQIINN